MVCCSVSYSMRAIKINITSVSTPAVFACITKVINTTQALCSIFSFLISRSVNLIRTCGWGRFFVGRDVAVQDTSPLARSNYLPVRDFP